MEKYLDITPGSVSVMGLMNDKEGAVRLLIDEDVLAADYFGCHPCVNTSRLKISVADLKEKIIPALSHPYTVVKLSNFIKSIDKFGLMCYQFSILKD